ncbi:MAG: helix-turn-helix domain-containing protein [Acidimicrobiaceae bacterium]|nr:helix-turn-helix domain-containing protein [Acidimicrobiia bacterium]MCY4492455.1 helix-turn-helix domain-containing protein [Acidimicrobiaceae bacterium]
MSAAGLLSISEAGDRLGVSNEQVRRYIQRGLLPAAKLANNWVIPYAQLQAFAAARPSRGRPLSSNAAWAATLNGEADLSDPHRYMNRSIVTRWEATPGAVADLMLRPDVVVSGMHAAQYHGALLAPLPDEARIYVEQSAAFDITEGFVADPLGRVIVGVVEPDNWGTLQQTSEPPRDPHSKPMPVTAACAPKTVVALDLAVSPHPRERDVAKKLIEP